MSAGGEGSWSPPPGGRGDTEELWQSSKKWAEAGSWALLLPWSAEQIEIEGPHLASPHWPPHRDPHSDPHRGAQCPTETMGPPPTVAPHPLTGARAASQGQALQVDPKLQSKLKVQEEISTSVPQRKFFCICFLLGYFLILLEKRVTVSPWKCAKSFPSLIFIGLSTDSQLREWQTSKRSKTLPASNEGESMSNFSYCPVKWHQGVACFVVLGTTSCTQSDFFPLDTCCREAYSKWDPGWNEPAKRHLTPVC